MTGLVVDQSPALSIRCALLVFVGFKRIVVQVRGAALNVLVARWLLARALIA